MSERIDLTDDDVVSTNGITGFEVSNTCKISELMAAVRTYLQGQGTGGYLNPRISWVKEGFKCQILRTQGGGWQQGRLRFRLEFVPEPEPEESLMPKEPESLLDEFRQLDGVD